MKRARSLAIALVLTGSPADPARAAEDVVTLTVAEAVARARASSPGLAGLRALAAAAGADERAARAERVPHVDLTAGYTRLSDVPELTLSLPGQPPRTIFPNIADNYRTRLSAAVPLYTGGRLDALADAARHEREAATHDLASGAADLVLETTDAYWALVTARATERVLAEALGAFEAHLEDARNRERFGLAARNEVLAVQVERDRAELTRLRAANAAAVREADLVRLVGLPPGARLEPDEGLSGGSGADEPLEPLVLAALAQRTEREALAARVAAAESRVRLQKGARLPQVSATAGIDYANPNRRLLPPAPRWEDSWDVSVNVGFTLFDGGRTAAAVESSRARAEALRHRLEDLDRRIRLQVTQRRLEVGAARQAVELAERNVAAARESLRVAGERHRAGVIPSSERLDAEVALLRATVDHTETLAQLRVAAAALDRAVGR